MNENSKKLDDAKMNNGQILSEITTMLYSYVLIVDVESGKYQFIKGTGLHEIGEIFEAGDDFETARMEVSYNIHPDYYERVMDLMDLTYFSQCAKEHGLIGRVEFPATYGDFTYKWNEMNFFTSQTTDGKQRVSIVGRDITDTRQAQDKNERELKANVAQNQILTEIIKLLYSYNMSLNLITGKYSLMVGTGLKGYVRILKSTDDYATIFAEKMKYVEPEFIENFKKLTGLQELQTRMYEVGFIGSMEYASRLEEEREWHEINVFMSIDHNGDPIANILGRDITLNRMAMEQKEKEQKAANSRDKLISGLTKMLYGYAIVVDSTTWKHTVITNDVSASSNHSMVDFIKMFNSSDDYVLVYSKLRRYMKKEDVVIFEKFVSPRALKELVGKEGYTVTKECTMSWSGKMQRHEVNLLVTSNEDGKTIFTLMCRDITESYLAQIKRENTLKAAVAKDQIMSEITRKIYGYNMIINLVSGHCDVIEGTGMRHVNEIVRSANGNYRDAMVRMITHIPEEYKEAFENTIGFDALMERKNENGLVNTLEYAAIIKDRKEWHEVQVFMGTNEIGEPVANVLGRDITVAHERAEAIAQLEIEKEANVAKSLFLSNMSHDIRTPINGIMGMLIRAKKNLDKEEILKDSLDKIQVSSNHLLSLINDVLDISKLEAGKQEFAQEAFSMQSLLNTCCSITQGSLESSDISFIKDFSKVSDKYVVGSELHIRQVLLNVLGNAVKYTVEGEVTFIAEEIPAEADKAKYRFIVKDTGIGMSEEFQKHVFDAFAQEDNTCARTKYKGTGLGMSIVKGLLEKMGGKIWVESTLNVGSTFTIEIELPTVIIEKKQKPEEIAEIPVNTENLKVLLVEDNELNMEFEKEILEDAGCIVSEAENGKIALDMFIDSAPGTYDMILMDVMMPVMNGIDAAKEIRRSGHPEAKSIPIIAQTANAFAEDIAAVKAAGMNEHVAKPIDVDQLLRVMSKYNQ